MKRKILFFTYLLTYLLTYKTGIAQEGKVGIGTTDPKATLHIAGGMAIREADDAILEERTLANQKILPDQQLFWDTNTGEVQLIDDEEFAFPFYIIDYKLRAPAPVFKEGNYTSNWKGDPLSDANVRDLIKDFDTTIKVDDYQAFLVFVYPEVTDKWGEYGYKDNDPELLAIRPLHFPSNKVGTSGDLLIFNNIEKYTSENRGYIEDYYMKTGVGKWSWINMNKILVPIREVQCVPDYPLIGPGDMRQTDVCKTWHIKIDYLQARPPKQWNYTQWNISFNWRVRLLLIDRAYCNIVEQDGEVHDKEETDSNGTKKYFPPTGVYSNPLANIKSSTISPTCPPNP